MSGKRMESVRKEGSEWREKGVSGKIMVSMWKDRREGSEWREKEVCG